MKRFFGLALLVFIGVAVWQIGSKLSADALGMGVGVLFGVMAGIPAALLVLASGRRREQRDPYPDPHQGRGQRGQMMPYGGYPQQPPVIVLTGNGMAQGYPQAGAGMPGQQHYLPQPGSPGRTLEAREFRVVGEKEEWVEEWS